MQRVQRHERYGGGAIWIGNQATMLPDVIAVDFRDYQRDVRFHSENRGVVDYHGTGLSRDGSVLRGKYFRRR